MALGVDAEWIYEDNKKTDFSKGQIIFLSTDGVWEVRNKKGEMLGKEPVLNTIRQNSSSDWSFRPKPINLLQPIDFMTLLYACRVRPTFFLYFTALNCIKIGIAVILYLTCKTLPYIVGAWLISTSKRKKEDPTCTFGK
jgi:hypothetical protein